MKKKLKNFIFKIIIFFTLFYILCNNNIILSKVLAQNDDYEQYAIDTFQLPSGYGHMIYANRGKDLFIKFNNIGYKKLKKLYEDMNTEQIKDAIYDIQCGMQYNNVKEKLEIYFQEVDRITLFNNISSQLDNIDTTVYNKEKIDELKVLRDKATESEKTYESNLNEKLKYDEHYYNGVTTVLGHYASKDSYVEVKENEIELVVLRSDLESNVTENPTVKLGKQIDEKIGFINLRLVMHEYEEGIVSNGINPNDYNPSKNPLTVEDSKPVTDKVGLILGFIRNISVVVSVIVLMVIGVKYILGSVEEKANYKATMLPYIVGCIMAISGTTIVTFIYSVFN